MRCRRKIAGDRCVVPFCSVRFSEFLSFRFARGGAPRFTWKKKIDVLSMI